VLFELLLLFIAGLLGGILNSIAGGGSFITFPALLFVGIPPLSANATNTFASLSGYLSGTFAFRQDLIAHRHELPRFIVTSLLGGIIGAWLLTRTPESVFREAIPWLLLFATLLFMFGAQLNRALKKLASGHRHASSTARYALLLLLLAICVYGGFFNAGFGIISLSYLVLAGYNNIHAMNGLKLLVSSCVSIIAVILFIVTDMIAWYEGSIVLAGTLLGGYLAAHLSRKLPQQLVRRFVILSGTGITLYYFYAIYFS
jgi:uncharacterized membrane protein YfcA